MSKKNKPEVKDVAIDADHIMYRLNLSNQDGLGGSVIGSKKVDLTKYKEHFQRIVDDYVTIAEVESIAYNYTIGKIRVIMSDQTNFRYEIFPEYKKGRPPSSKLMRRMKKWARKKYHFEPNTEADDVVAYYVRKGAIGFTEDKDLFNGVEGLWYNAHYKHRCWVRTTEDEAEYFFKQQILGGDGGDNIPSIDGVGLITADKLMKKYGSGYEDIFSIFKDTTKVLGKIHRTTSYGRNYALTMARLVCMSQWTPKKGIRLWKIPK